MMTNSKKCSICKKLLPIEDFYVRQDRNKPISRCKQCNYNLTKKYKEALTPEQRRSINKKRSDYFAKQAREGNVKAIIQHKLASYRGNAKDKGVEFDLTTDYLVELFHSQNGKCYYTGVTLETTSMLGEGRITLKNRPNQMSLDRLDPQSGYVKGNVVWCSYLVNTCKNMFSETEFYSMCQQVLEHRKHLLDK